MLLYNYVLSFPKSLKYRVNTAFYKYSKKTQSKTYLTYSSHPYRTSAQIEEGKQWSYYN